MAHLIGEQWEGSFPPDKLDYRQTALWEESLKDYLLENSLSLLLESGNEDWILEIVEIIWEGVRSRVMEETKTSSGRFEEILFRVRKEVLTMLS